MSHKDREYWTKEVIIKNLKKKYKLDRYRCTMQRFCRKNSEKLKVKTENLSVRKKITRAENTNN